MPCAAQKPENCRTASREARRVLGLRICELKKSRIRVRASGRGEDGGQRCRGRALDVISLKVSCSLLLLSALAQECRNITGALSHRHDLDQLVLHPIEHQVLLPARTGLGRP
jgi:hypothetical protein